MGGYVFGHCITTKLRVGSKSWYTPDALNEHRRECVDVKSVYINNRNLLLLRLVIDSTHNQKDPYIFRMIYVGSLLDMFMHCISEDLKSARHFQKIGRETSQWDYIAMSWIGALRDGVWLILPKVLRLKFKNFEFRYDNSRVYGFVFAFIEIDIIYWNAI